MERRHPNKSGTRDGGDRDAYCLAHLKADTKDAELWKAVHRACKKVKRTWTTAVTRIFERHVHEMEEQLRGFFHYLKSMERWRKRRRLGLNVFAMRTGKYCVMRIS